MSSPFNEWCEKNGVDLTVKNCPKNDARILTYQEYVQKYAPTKEK